MDEYSYRSNGVVDGGKIINSQIDMNDTYIIKNHPDPIQDTDVVNKRYVDNHIGTGGTGGGTSINVILNSTNYTDIITSTQGVFNINVKNSVSGGPCAVFIISKNSSSANFNMTRVVSSAGTTTEERLEVRWDPGEFIKLRKTGNNYDGVYNIVYTQV